MHKRIISKIFEERYGYQDIESYYQDPKKKEITWEELDKIFNETEEQFVSDNNFNKGLKHIPEALGFVFKKFLKAKMQKDIYKEYVNKYAVSKTNKFGSSELITGILMMDFFNEFNGYVNRNIVEQIKEYNSIAAEYNALPFLAIDPRRIDETLDEKHQMFHLILKAFNRQENGLFVGLKFYPSLGYSPSDYRLLPIYEICQEYKIPIVTHCGGEIVSSFDSDIKIYENFEENLKAVPGKSRKQKAFYLNDPKRWEVVLERFKNLKINFAHFGDDVFRDKNEDPDFDYLTRKDTIITMMKSYPGVYSDFSYSLIRDYSYSKLIQLLKTEEIVSKRLMFGSDFWVVLLHDKDKFLNIQENFISEFDDDEISDRFFRRNAVHYLLD
ncbi:amidohydrolase family protein [Sphingobacterium sp. WM]|uniref:amidohydrolase family protein n=1 Tax=Sphingobacterium sp. WM TaxID=3031802 RepID=UPI00240CF63E|nr:amidohydrolase family protein [Sphingobacterium sp. WM]WFB62113.1 amidohydrolase family protein [Sphingobacterium sp. WM]